MKEKLRKIEELTNSLPRAERAVAQAILEKPEIISLSTLAEVSKHTGTSDASIIRFCRKLGYSGYAEMKKDFILAINNNDNILSKIEEATENSTVIENLYKIYERNMMTLKETIALADPVDYEAAVDIILKARGLWFFGAGDAAAVCKLFHFKFSRLGYIGGSPDDPVMQLIDASAMTDQDVAIVITYEGNSRNINNAVKVAKQRGAKIILITKTRRSSIKEFADVTIFISTSDITVGKDIIVRRVAEQMIIDALYLTLLSKQDRGMVKQLNDAATACDLNKEYYRKKESAKDEH